MRGTPGSGRPMFPVSRHRRRATRLQSSILSAQLSLGASWRYSFSYCFTAGACGLLMRFFTICLHFRTLAAIVNSKLPQGLTPHACRPKSHNSVQFHDYFAYKCSFFSSSALDPVSCTQVIEWLSQARRRLRSVYNSSAERAQPSWPSHRRHSPDKLDQLLETAKKSREPDSNTHAARRLRVNSMVTHMEHRIRELL
jgi:hypothetical protein